MGELVFQLIEASEHPAARVIRQDRLGEVRLCGKGQLSIALIHKSLFGFNQRAFPMMRGQQLRWRNGPVRMLEKLVDVGQGNRPLRSEEHTSELQSLRHL